MGSETAIETVYGGMAGGVSKFAQSSDSETWRLSAIGCRIGDMEQDRDELWVYLRDLRSGEWVTFEPAVWIDDFSALTAEAHRAHAETVGGSLHVTGTPESGRITVLDAAGGTVVDSDWHTMTRCEAIERAKVGVNPVGG